MCFIEWADIVRQYPREHAWVDDIPANNIPSDEPGDPVWIRVIQSGSWDKQSGLRLKLDTGVRV